MNGDWRVWQLIDSAFPTGGFAHAGGLEAAWQVRVVCDVETLIAFAQASLTQTARSAGPFVRAVHAEPSRFAELDAVQEAMLSNHVANRASRAQGRALLSSAGQIFDDATAQAILQPASSTSARLKLPVHVAGAFGLVARAIAVPADAVASMFLFAALRGLTSSAVRLGIVGPMEAQSLQARLADGAGRLALACSADPDDTVQTSPMLDLIQGSQDRLYSRLFQS
jgi:urease accessory protein